MDAAHQYCDGCADAYGEQHVCGQAQDAVAGCYRGCDQACSGENGRQAQYVVGAEYGIVTTEYYPAYGITKDMVTLILRASERSGGSGYRR